MTIPRYIAVVAAVYSLTLLTIVVMVGEVDVSTPDAILRLWPVAAGAIGMAVLGTVVVIARFGDAGGSIYVLPMVLHSFLIVVTVIVAATTFGD